MPDWEFGRNLQPLCLCLALKPNLGSNCCLKGFVRSGLVGVLRGGCWCGSGWGSCPWSMIVHYFPPDIETASKLIVSRIGRSAASRNAPEKRTYGRSLPDRSRRCLSVRCYSGNVEAVCRTGGNPSSASFCTDRCPVTWLPYDEPRPETIVRADGFVKLLKSPVRCMRCMDRTGGSRNVWLALSSALSHFTRRRVCDSLILVSPSVLLANWRARWRSGGFASQRSRRPRPYRAIPPRYIRHTVVCTRMRGRRAAKHRRVPLGRTLLERTSDSSDREESPRRTIGRDCRNDEALGRGPRFR